MLSFEQGEKISDVIFEDVLEEHDSTGDTSSTASTGRITSGASAKGARQRQTDAPAPMVPSAEQKVFRIKLWPSKSRRSVKL